MSAAKQKPKEWLSDGLKGKRWRGWKNDSQLCYVVEVGGRWRKVICVGVAANLKAEGGSNQHRHSLEQATPR